jgi:hypothetical protein
VPVNRESHAFQAILALDEGQDRAPGAAVTVKLCGHWEHAGPCRWPHHRDAIPDPREGRPWPSPEGRPVGSGS